MDHRSPGDILKTEFSEEFVRYMKNRMVMSYFKYGSVKDAAGKVKFLEDVKRRIDKYLATGNTEWLVDAANNIMMEFMFPSVEGAHFKATDSKESPGRTTIQGTMSSRHNDDLPSEGE